MTPSLPVPRPRPLAVQVHTLCMQADVAGQTARFGGSKSECMALATPSVSLPGGQGGRTGSVPEPPARKITACA